MHIHRLKFHPPFTAYMLTAFVNTIAGRAHKRNGPVPRPPTKRRGKRRPPNESIHEPLQFVNQRIMSGEIGARTKLILITAVRRPARERGESKERIGKKGSPGGGRSWRRLRHGGDSYSISDHTGQPATNYDRQLFRPPDRLGCREKTRPALMLPRASAEFARARRFSGRKMSYRVLVKIRYLLRELEAERHSEPATAAPLSDKSAHASRKGSHYGTATRSFAGFNWNPRSFMLKGWELKEQMLFELQLFN